DSVPYLGLAHYSEKDKGLFFGRERETQEVFEKMRQLAAPANKVRLLVILGASGAGKSSLLRAGLWPQLGLRPREWLPLVPLIPEQNAFRGVTPASALVQSITDSFAYYQRPRSQDIVRDHLESKVPGEGFAWIANELRGVAGAPAATLVL